MYQKVISALWPKRLSIRLPLMFGLLVLVTMSMFTYLNTTEQTERITTSLKNQATILAENLAFTAGDLLLARDYTAIENMLIRSARFRGIKSIQLSDQDGKLIGDVVKIGDSEPTARYGRPPLLLPIARKLSISFTQTEMIVWEPVILGDLIGWVKIAYNLDEISDAKTRAMFDGLLDGIIELIIISLVVLLMIRKPLTSIDYYTRFADRLDDSSGEQIKVDNSALELEKLGLALNKASSRLYQQTNAIRKALSDLERLAAFAENSPDIVLSMNYHGKIQYINPRAQQTLSQFGMTHDELFTLLPPDIHTLINNCIDEQSPSREIAMDYGDRTYLWTLAPVVGQEIIHCYAIDITHMKKAEEEARNALVAKIGAEQANKAKSQFLANMSHELRTPLNAIIGYSEILEDEAIDLGFSELTPDLNRIRNAGKHLLALINEILDLSKIEAGKMEMFIEEANLSEIIYETIDTAETLAKQKRNRVIAHVDDNLGTICTDITKLRQVVYNLLSNASKFTENGTITLNVSQFYRNNVNWIRIEVKDTGIGMTKEQLSRIFNAFSQADNSTTRRFGGTGLGLSITKKFCEMMGGNIVAHSERHYGTQFVVNLPTVINLPLNYASNA